MSFLANKYRPQTLADLVGQKQIVNAIKYAIENNILGSAILLTGKFGVGKTTIARLIAKCVNCISWNNGDLCNNCDCCVAISNGSCPDVDEFDAASNTGVDDISTVIESSHYMPSMCRRKVYIIDEAHMLSKSAFNAMLKTLEESDTNSLFIMATTEYEKVPATIASRCLKFMLEDITEKDIESRIIAIAKEEEIKIDQEAAALVARKANGSLRNAIVLLEQGLSQMEENKVISRKIIESVSKAISLDDLVIILANALDGKINDAVIHLRSVSGFTASNFLAELSQVLYQCVMINLALESVTKENLRALAAKISIDRAIELWELVLRSSVEIKAMANPILSLELLIAKIGLKSHQEASHSFPPNKHDQELRSQSNQYFEQLNNIDQNLTLNAQNSTLLENRDCAIDHSTNNSSVISSEIAFSDSENSKINSQNKENAERENAESDILFLKDSSNEANKLVPNSFESFAKIFVVKKEAILSYYLNNKMKAINYSVFDGLGKIEIERIEIPDKIIKKIEQLANEWTGIKWQILMKDQGVEKIKTISETKIDQYKNTPLVNQILEEFPDSEINLIS